MNADADADSMDINTPITTLEDFARYQYKKMTRWLFPNVVNDNQTTVAFHHGWNHLLQGLVN
ncbi:MAG TPA: hypothetical protein VE445_13415 [Nitrososphaeraceae archaeon]|nr:hypothetical protein [Nitrososphaeraceae archaeon]